jgi:hypothetical protein
VLNDSEQVPVFSLPKYLANLAPFPLKIVCFFHPQSQNFPLIQQPELACNEYRFLQLTAEECFILWLLELL